MEEHLKLPDLPGLPLLELNFLLDHLCYLGFLAYVNEKWKITVDIALNPWDDGEIFFEPPYVVLLLLFLGA